MDTVEDFPTLEQDATLAEPLRRVSYEAGMMLGLEATRDEQAYHRRRLNRHQYWLHGYGTLAGMAVLIDPATHANNTDPVNSLRLIVSPGIGIDGLGREVLIHEAYCINLRQWLDAQTESHLREGYDDPANKLWLKVCVRQKDCPVGQQPVLARKLNLSTDAVQPSRTQDSVQLELIPELPPTPGSNDPFEPWSNRGPDATGNGYAPWSAHGAVAAALPTLTSAEQATLTAVQAANANAGAQLALHARLLHALDTTGVNTKELSDELQDGARLLLARISIDVTDINAIVVNPQLISINNLVRPFLATASQLAWLARQP